MPYGHIWDSLDSITLKEKQWVRQKNAIIYHIFICCPNSESSYSLPLESPAHFPIIKIKPFC